MSKNVTISSTLYLSLWIMPISIALFIVFSLFVRGYDSQFNYVLSIYPLFIALLAALINIYGSFVFCYQYGLVVTKPNWIILWAISIVFNIFGGYHFYRKLRAKQIEKIIEIRYVKSFGALEVFCLFFLFSFFFISVLMSDGVGTTFQLR